MDVMIRVCSHAASFLRELNAEGVGVRNFHKPEAVNVALPKRPTFRSIQVETFQSYEKMELKYFK